MLLPATVFPQVTEEKFAIANLFSSETALRPQESQFTGVKF